MAKQNKKFVATTLTAAMVASAVAPVAGAAFTDSIPTYAKDAVGYVTEKGIMNGLGGTTEFGAAKNITRAEVAVLLSNALGLDTKGKTANFSDVPATHWASGAIAAVVEAGIAQGTGTGFNPAGQITRQEAAVMFANAYDVELNELAEVSFKDQAKIATWAKEQVEVLASLGIFGGKEGGLFAPTDLITRGEVAALVHRTEVADVRLKVAEKESALVDSIKAINATTVEVTYKEAVADVNATKYTIEGLTVSNAAVKQTNAKTVVLTTSVQTGDKEYTVKAGETTLGKFKGVSAVIPSAIKVVEQSIQGVLGQEVTVKAQVTVKEGDSKAAVPVTFNISGSNTQYNQPQVVEVTTNADGVASYTYTRYAGTTDTVVAYATGDRTKFSNGTVHWAAAKQLTIKDITEATTITNGGKKVYEISSSNFKNGYVFVAFQGNLNVSPDKVVKGVTVEGNTVHTLGTTSLGSGVPGTALTANKYPFKSSLGSEQVIAVKLNASGKANLVLTGTNASAIPVVYEGNLLSSATNAHTSFSNYDARYNVQEVQAVASEVKFERTVNYGLTLEAKGVQNATRWLSADETGGRDYVVTYTKEDGKPVAAGSTVYVAIPKVGLSSPNSFKLLNEDGNVVSPVSEANYFVYALTTDKEGKALFTVTSPGNEDYVQPITFINDNRTVTSTIFDKDDTQATADYTYFTNVVEYSAGLKLVTDTGKKQESFSLNEAANYTFSLVDQNGKTRKANKPTQVTFNVTTGEGAVTVNTSRLEAHSTKQFTLPLAEGSSSVNARIVGISPTNVSVYATSSQAGETFLPTEVLNATFTQYASVTGITGHTNAGLLDKVNRTFNLVSSNGKVYTYSYDATNIRLNNSTIDVASFEAEVTKGAKVTVAKDADGNIYFNIVETGVKVPVQATINKLIDAGETTISDAKITAAGGTEPTNTDEVTINYGGTGTLVVNLAQTKNLRINAPYATNVTISGAIAQDLVIDADNAHVDYTAGTIGRDVIIQGVKDNSFVVASGVTISRNIIVNDTTGSKITLNNTFAGSLVVNTPNLVIIDSINAVDVQVKSSTAQIKDVKSNANIYAPAGTVIKNENGVVIEPIKTGTTGTLTLSSNKVVKGDKVVVTITDADLNLSSTEIDTLKFMVGADEKTATETGINTGVFTYEITTDAVGPLVIKYVDAKNQLGKTENITATLTVEDATQVALGTPSFVSNTIIFNLVTDLDVTGISGEDFLKVLKYQMRNVGRLSNGTLVSYNSSGNTGALINGEWVTSGEAFTALDQVEKTEVNNITFQEFNTILKERFAKDSNNGEFSGPNYEKVTTKIKNGKLVVTFGTDFLKWTALHGYVDNNYNITAHLDLEVLAGKLSARGVDVTASGTSSFKITLQGQANGTFADPVSVKLSEIK